MPRTRTSGQNNPTAAHQRSFQAHQDSSVSVTQTRLSRKCGGSSSTTSVSRGGTIWQRRQTNEEQQVFDASSPLTQADLPRIIKVVLTFLSTQPQHLPTTAPEDASTPDNESELHLDLCHVDLIPGNFVDATNNSHSPHTTKSNWEYSNWYSAPTRSNFPCRKSWVRCIHCDGRPYPNPPRVR